MGFEDFEPIFGQPKAEWLAQSSTPLCPFLFHVHALDPSRLRVFVTDFHSSTWEAVKSVQQLEDMRDNIGIGGSWSDFVDYLVASIRSEDVKLVLEWQSKLDGAAYAKLIAQKSKGMPLISIPLAKLRDAAASEAKANFSLELYKTFKSMQGLLIHAQERSCKLTKLLSAKEEKNEAIQGQLDTLLFSKRKKSQKLNDKADSDALSDKQAAQSLASTKVVNRVAPVYRRAKVRGVLLHDTEGETDN